jgi:hypothetical protein
MSPRVREFEGVKAEADIYFAYLQKIDQDEARLEQRSGETLVHEPFGREFKTILKANAIILLYHMIEGTVQRSVDGIVEAVRQDNLGYSDVSEELRNIWSAMRVRQMRRANEETWVEHLNQVIDKCIQKEALALNGRDIVKSHSGNITAQTIRDLAKEFGFEIEARPEARGGDDLERIKHSRNLLAHGVQRFTEVGGGMTVAELFEIKQRVVCYLEDLIRCSDGYVHSKGFRIPGPTAAQ